MMDDGVFFQVQLRAFNFTYKGFHNRYFFETYFHFHISIVEGVTLR